MGDCQYIQHTSHVLCIKLRIVCKSFCKLFYFFQSSTLKEIPMSILYYYDMQIHRLLITYQLNGKNWYKQNLFFEMLCVLACHSRHEKMVKMAFDYCYCHRTFKYVLFSHISARNVYCIVGLPNLFGGIFPRKKSGGLTYYRKPVIYYSSVYKN